MIKFLIGLFFASIVFTAVLVPFIINSKQAICWLTDVIPWTETNAQCQSSTPIERITLLEQQLQTLEQKHLLQNQTNQAQKTIQINQRKKFELALEKINTQYLTVMSQLKQKKTVSKQAKNIDEEKSYRFNHLNLDQAAYTLKDIPIILEYSDDYIDNSLHIMKKLETIGFNVRMKFAGENFEKHYLIGNKTIFYTQQRDLGLALKLLDILSNDGYKNVKKKTVSGNHNKSKFYL